jgi:hypothetical protein
VLSVWSERERARTKAVISPAAIRCPRALKEESNAFAGGGRFDFVAEFLSGGDCAKSEVGGGNSLRCEGSTSLMITGPLYFTSRGARCKLALILQFQLFL